MSILQKLSSWLRDLEHCSSTSEKIAIIQKAGAESPAFKRMLWWALNPYKKFGVKQIPFAHCDGLTQSSLSWKEVDALLELITNDCVRGDKLKEFIMLTMKQLVPSDREVFKRILLKDLRCGVGATLVNKAIPGLIPEFGIMLAEPLEEKHLKRLQQQEYVYFQPKKNGDRSAHIIKLDNLDSAQAYSRKGHPQNNYGHITNALYEVCVRAKENFTFDGEVINQDFWGTRKVKKLAGNEASNAVLHVFDIIPLAQWEEGVTSRYSKRRAMLKDIWEYVDADMPLVRVPSYKVKGSEVTWELIEQCRQKFVEQGDEGLMIRLDLPYNFKTRNSLFKRKVMIEGDFMILEILEGEKGKKYEGMAAKVLVDLGDDISCEVGLKGDVATRQELYKNRNKYVGMMCEVHYQGLTECLDGNQKLQFGIMTRLRDDKS